MYKDFDTLEIPLSKVQVLRRRDRFYPVAGLPDALNAVYTYQKKKKMQMYIGENFTGWVKFKDGKLLSLQTITPFGSSSHRRSKHYDDQTEMFTKGQLKDIVFDEQLLRIQASRVYNPPAFSNK